MEQHNLLTSPELVWNCDETHFQLEHTPVAVCARKGSRSLPGRTSNSKEGITALVTVNAAGDAMPPMCVVKGKTHRSLNTFEVDKAPPGSVWTWQERAWMTELLGDEWFSKVFVKNCGPRRPQLLILDFHGSNEVLSLLERAMEENIIIFALPPHTTAWLQPLDRTVFGPLSSAYNDVCTTYLSEDPNHMVTKSTWVPLFAESFGRAVTKENISSGFKSCGIYPFNAEAIPMAAFHPSSAYNVPREARQTIASSCQQSVNPDEVDRCPQEQQLSSQVIVDPVGEQIQQPSTSSNVVLAELALPVADNGCDTLESSPLTAEELFQTLTGTTLPCSPGLDEINCNWNAAVDNIFGIPEAVNTSTSTPKTKKITSHRLLTTPEIIAEKKRQLEEKKTKELAAADRKKKRDEKAAEKLLGIATNKTKKTKKTREADILCEVCMVHDDHSGKWVGCDTNRCPAWVHFGCIPHSIVKGRTFEEMSSAKFFCPKCQWLSQ